MKMVPVAELFSLEIISEDGDVCTVSSFGEVSKVPKYALENAYPEPYPRQNLLQDFEWWQLTHEITDETVD